jgi:hypothetical protein
MVSTYRQQAVLNTNILTFVTTHMNTITEARSFWLDGAYYRLGHKGETFRTNYLGVATAPALPNTGWFGGNAVGADTLFRKEF